MKVALLSLYNRSVFPPLGLGYIAAWLHRALPNVTIRIIDANFEDVERETVKWKPDLVGINAMTAVFKKTCDLSSKIKKSIGVPIVVGGHHVTLLPQSLPDCIDVGVIGEGEKTFTELVVLAMYKKASHDKWTHKHLDMIAGIVYRKEGRLVQTPPRPLIDDLSQLPMLDYEYMAKQYLYPKYHEGRLRSMATMTSSRGCPFSCIYCSVPAFWGKGIRAQEPEYIASHIAILKHKYGIEHVEFMDDYFIVNVSRVNKLIEAFNKAGILGKITVTVLTRAESVNEEMCKALKRLKTLYVGFGFESASPRVLRYMKGGNATPEYNIRAIKLLKQHGISSGGNVMFGTPTEKIHDMNLSVNFIDEARKLGALVGTSVTTPLPGTPLWNMAMERGIVSPQMDFDNLDFFDETKAMMLDSDVNKHSFMWLFKSTKSLRRTPFWRTVYNLVILHPYSTTRALLTHPLYYIKRLIKML